MFYVPWRNQTEEIRTNFSLQVTISYKQKPVFKEVVGMFTPQTLIKDVLQQAPGSQRLLMDNGVRCLG